MRSLKDLATKQSSPPSIIKLYANLLAGGAKELNSGHQSIPSAGRIRKFWPFTFQPKNTNLATTVSVGVSNQAMGRLPTSADFPPKVKLSVVPPPTGDSPTNILVLLHGLGDNHESFTNLGKQMNLPETACVSVQGPQGLLDLGGFHWGDDIIFDSTSGGLDADAGFKQTTELFQTIIKDALIAKCGYAPREIVFFGFGQGGMAALQAAGELGGIVSIGGGLPSDAPASLDPKCKTPVLVCAGSDQSSVTQASEDKLKKVFDFVEVKRYRKPGDSMPSNRDEMMPIMQFFSRRLKSTKGVPAGSVEVG